MDPKRVIYFTKEDGKNIALTAGISTLSFVSVADLDNPVYEEKLGHKPTNLYMLVDGVELALLPPNDESVKKGE